MLAAVAVALIIFIMFFFVLFATSSTMGSMSFNIDHPKTSLSERRKTTDKPKGALHRHKSLTPFVSVPVSGLSSYLSTPFIRCSCSLSPLDI